MTFVRRYYKSKGPTRSKYRNKKIELDGFTFDSIAESKRYGVLNLRRKIAEIADLELQPRFDIIINGKKCGYYKADFRYRVIATGEIVIEDVKSEPTKTPLYRLKKKIIEALYCISIIEIS